MQAAKVFLDSYTTVSTQIHEMFKYFKKNQISSKAKFITPRKAKLRKLQENTYKEESLTRVKRSPDPEPELSYLESVLNTVAPTSITKLLRPTSRKDQLYLYLEEAPISYIRVINYQKSQERDQPELTAMAFDFLCIPIISSEYEQVFSSCAKQTTPESSRLIGLMM